MTGDDNQKRLLEIVSILEIEFPNAKIILNHQSPFELFVATILSAQCTDERVNLVTNKLFKKYRTPEEFARLENEVLEREIYSTGYFKSKAKHIIEASKILLEKYNGKIPNTIEELIKLPGVGRKTANVILGHCFAQPSIVVDTHVIRITNRLGIVNSKNPIKIEKKLMQLLPSSMWIKFTHLLISHGRKFCSARNPKCSICPINHLCPSRLS